LPQASGWCSSTLNWFEKFLTLLEKISFWGRDGRLAETVSRQGAQSLLNWRMITGQVFDTDALVQDIGVGTCSNA